GSIRRVSPCLLAMSAFPSFANLIEKSPFTAHFHFRKSSSAEMFSTACRLPDLLIPANACRLSDAYNIIFFSFLLINSRNAFIIADASHFSHLKNVGFS
ncbi:MAG: hypothetical protein J5825_08185, partial [Lachnospiraceae bacterium]|nr:hypothetical protein [Lachnospiraceae bacterium]